MSTTAPKVIQRQLDALDLEVRLRRDDGTLASFVDRLRAIGEDAGAIGLTELEGIAALREGELLLLDGEPGLALDAFGAAHTAFEAVGARDRLATVLARTSEAMIGLDVPWSGVLEVCERGIELVEADRYRTSAPYLQAGYLYRTITLYSNGVRAAHALDDRRYVTWSELSKSRALSGIPTGADVPPDTDESDLVRELTALGERIEEAQRDGRDPSVLQRRRSVLFDRLVIARRRAATLPEPDVAAMQLGLTGGQIALSYYWLDAASLLLIALSVTDLETHVISVAAGDRELLTRFSAAAHGTGPAPVPAGEQRLLLERLLNGFGDTLLSPVAAMIADARRVLVSPHRALHVVPFGAVPFDGRALVRHAAVANIPNLTCLQRQIDTPARPPFRAVLAGATTYADCPPLLDSVQEVDTVATSYTDVGFDVDHLIDERVTARAITDACRSRTQPPVLLHLAVHGLNVDAGAPLESALVLPRDRLDGIDLTNLRLEGTTIVLSACSSGQRAILDRSGSSELAGDDMLGLQTAFFAAGARQVLGTLWAVDTAVAADIAIGFHRRLLEGDPADVALHRTISAKLDDDPLWGLYAYRWAPFVLVCLGAPAPLPRPTAASEAAQPAGVAP